MYVCMYVSVYLIFFIQEVLRTNSVQPFIGECTKLLRKLEANNKKELEYFKYPVNIALVTDYLNYVQRPIHYNYVKESMTSYF